METESVREAFDLRYYRWSLDQSLQEQERGFPHLRSFPTGTAPRFLSFYDHVSAREREIVTKAMAKRWVSDPYKYLGEAVTDEERQVIDKFMAFHQWPTSGEQQRQRGIADGSIPRLKRKILSKQIRHRLEPFFGAKGENWGGGGVWRYVTKARYAEIVTFVDTGGNFHELNYSHSIICEPRDGLREHISLFSYMGLSSQTMWNKLSEWDLDPVTGCVEDLVRTFITSMQAILETL